MAARRMWICGTLMSLFFMMASAAHAVPILQVGAPASPSDIGTYADYKDWSNPTEAETARTSGNVIYAAASYGVDNQPLLIGGQYTGTEGTGKDWYDDNATYSFGFDSAFKDKGAILLVSLYLDDTMVDDTDLALLQSGLKLDRDDDSPDMGQYSAFYRTNVNPLTGLSWWPTDYNDVSNHEPVKEANAYLFFDIGNFNNDTSGIRDFANELPNPNEKGQIKKLTFSGLDSTTNYKIQWAHFDLLAIVTDKKGKSKITSTLVNNPASHDVTMVPDGGGPPQAIPEPASLVLLGTGLAGTGALLRKRRKK